jgi:putative DNA primase/helicase
VYWSLDGAPETTRRACTIWRDRTPLSHPEAAVGVGYLTGRGLPAPYPEALAFAVLPHPDTDEDLPTLVVARHCPVVGKVRGIQRIFLDPAGGKYGGGTAKMSLGSIHGGRAELLREVRPERLLIGEGVETTLSAARLFGYGSAWAMCGGFPREMALPPSVRLVLLVADHDKSGTSEKKALALARWIIGTGRECTIEIPNSLGADANDVLKAVAIDTHGRLSGAAGGRPAASELASRS